MISLRHAFLVAAGLMLSAIAAQAADSSANYSTWRRDTAPVAAPYVRQLPFPRSERTQAIWAEGSCWKQCQIACTSDLNVCLQGNPAPFNIFTFNPLLPASAQAQCIAATDSCDRGCQYQCRTYGGPLLPPIPQ